MLTFLLLDSNFGATNDVQANTILGSMLSFNCDENVQIKFEKTMAIWYVAAVYFPKIVSICDIKRGTGKGNKK